MAQPSMVVRIAANLAALKANLAEGRNQIEVTTAGMQKLATSFQGDKIIQQAHNVVAAVHQIGGASKLTEAEQARVNATVERALEKYRVLGREAPAALQQLATDTKKVDTETTSWSKRIDGAVTGAVAGLTAAVTTFGIQAAQAAIRGFGEWTKRGSEVSALRNSFTALSGGVAEADGRMLSLRTATRGLIGDFDLMLASNKGMLLDLNLSAGQMGELAKTASILGRAMGQDATKSLDDLITALGRSSPMILDNLGLSVKVGEANEVYAEKLGKAASALTDAEKKQAFMNAALDAAAEKTRTLGGLQLTATDRITQMWTSIKNVSDATASWVVNLGLVNHGLEGVATSMGTLEALFRGGPRAALNAYKQATGDFIPELATLNQTMGFTKASATALAVSETELEAIEKKLTESVKESVKAQEAAAKSISFVDGELTPLTRLMIDGTIPAIGQFATETGYAELELVEMQVELARLRGELISFGPVLQNAFQANPLVPFKGTVIEADTSTRTFFQKWKDGMTDAGMGAQGLSALFSQAFIGGGGAIGAIKAFATQGLATLMGMIPGLPPWVQAFSGPIIEGLSKLAAKAKDLLSSIFGGPSSAEKEGRRQVEEYEATLRSTLTETQRLEAGTDGWKQTVVAVRDAYLAAGRTEAEALAAVERLWASSRNGAGAVEAAIQEIKDVMAGVGPAASAAAAQATQAFNGIPRNITIDFEAKYHGFGEEGAASVRGEGASSFVGGSFAGASTPAPVFADGRASVPAGDGVSAVAALIGRLERVLPLAMRDAVLQGGG